MQEDYWRAHQFNGVIADPFMGGGTPILEANRLGFSIVGADINPMAFWIVRQSLAPLDLDAFGQNAEAVICDLEREIGSLYITTCKFCDGLADVKYFLWVKTQTCPECGAENDLFPGYLLAEAERHPYHVVVCHKCGELNEFKQQPTKSHPESCCACGEAVFVDGPSKRNKMSCSVCSSVSVFVDGPSKRNKMSCSVCSTVFAYPEKNPSGPPKHRMWAIEYHCSACKPNHKGRFFKTPDKEDLKRCFNAKRTLEERQSEFLIPSAPIPLGDETKRLHRWGYRLFSEMFNERQLLGLGLLLKRICAVEETQLRHALLTVFSDFLRYQNMLARYDTYALKCQDIFSVHGFPVGLVQCENSILGIPKVGAGAFRHFIEKYRRAKDYCQQPFETRPKGRRKELIPILGESIKAQQVKRLPKANAREAWINSLSAERVPLKPDSLDGVFTDPPYFDNVQYAELMDFCYVWLRLALGNEFDAFKAPSTKTLQELTGNEVMGRGLEHFTRGLSKIFCHYAVALKPGAPFVFTFHHNDPRAYIPIVVAILDAGLDCTATLPVPAEMGASLHIAGTRSSVLDSVFVCRKVKVRVALETVPDRLKSDLLALQKAGLRVTEGDVRCLLAGHIARTAINRLRVGWELETTLQERMGLAGALIAKLREELDADRLLKTTTESALGKGRIYGNKTAL
ncbi:Adenine-specific DNA methylase containing a Zn-ribbon-like protein [Syntrophobacter sp. SbD2]|nr:Adenine-specific DNA methylase containing a Zn-ribbon-like protein [Syntrophobacter sp. SbD2]